MRVQVLEQMGWRTCIAENGREALEQVELHQPQLVCMDRHMPVGAAPAAASRSHFLVSVCVG